MPDDLSAVTAELKLEPTPVTAPADEVGQWLFVFAKFGTRGFLRCLACDEPAKIFVHFVLPGWTLTDACRAAEIYTENTTFVWEARAHDGGFALVASLGESGNWSEAIAFGGRLSEFVDSDQDAVTTLRALFGSHVEAPGEIEATTKSAFEQIGEVQAKDVDDSSHATSSREPKLSLTASGESAQVTLDIGRTPKPSQLQKFASALRRHLRSYADVDVDIMASESSDRVVLEVRAAEWAEFKTQQALMEAIQHAVTPLENMLAHGVSPEVALGLVGADGVQISASPSRVGSEREEVVFSATEGAALKPGVFDDPRLSQPQSTEPLVDVILRHPGYSDRRVGQVLSILLSIAYHDALRLMQASPVVIARAVANARALRMQEVIEGAGGKIQLTDPDRYPVA